MDSMADIAPLEQPPTPPAPSDPPLVMLMAKAIWTVYQSKFTGGHAPPAGEWERRMAHLQDNPGLGQPFEEAAIESARAAFVLVMHTLRRGTI